MIGMSSRRILLALALANVLTWSLVAHMAWPREPQVYQLAPNEMVCSDHAGWLACET